MPYYQSPSYPVTYAAYSRTYPPHGMPLSITTRDLPATGWQLMHSDCDSPIETYPLQVTAPEISSQSYSANYGQQSIRTWAPVSDRSVAGPGSYSERDQMTTSMPYLNSSGLGRPPIVTEAPSAFSVMDLQASLPRIPPLNRQLPVPTTTMRQMSVPQIMDGPPTHLLPGPSSFFRIQNPPSYYASGSWPQDHYQANYRGGSSSTAVSAAQVETVQASIATAPAAGSAATAPQNYTEENAPMGNVATALASQNSVSSSTEATTPTMLNAASALSHLSGYPQPSTSSHMLNRNEPISTLADYQYSPDRSTLSLNPSQPESDTLSNGQRYEPLARPQPERVANMNAIRHQSWENDAAPMRQTPMTTHEHSYQK